MKGLTHHILGRIALFLTALLVIAASAFVGTSSIAAQASTAPASAPRPVSAAGHASTTAFSAADPFALVNLNADGHCLGINSSGDAGDWTCTFANDQAWHMGSSWDNDGVYYQLINTEGQCLGVSGGSMTAGARVVGYACLTSHMDQYWSFVPYDTICEGAGCYYVVQDLNSNDILGVAGASMANGAAIVQWPWNGVPDEAATNQYWQYVSAS
jgi:hypothetical protein